MRSITLIILMVFSFSSLWAQDYTVDVKTGGNGTVTPLGVQNVSGGANLDISADPGGGFVFTTWTVATVSGSAGLTVNQAGEEDTYVSGGANGAEYSVTATFEDGHELTINATNGSVTKNPDKLLYKGGEVVTLTPVPATGYHFTVWSGDLTGSTSPEDITIDADKTVTAGFAINTYDLTYTAGANGSIDGATSQTVDYDTDGTEVTADPDENYHFVDWSDGSTVNPRTDANVTANISVTANFKAIPVVSDIPDQSVVDPEDFTVINLDNYVSDDDAITWTVTEQGDLTIDYSPPSTTTITYTSTGSIYTKTVTFTAEDTDGNTDFTTTTFTVYPPFSISDDPDNVEEYSGKDVSFSVTAAGGTGTYIYQWWRGTTSPTTISGATSATLPLNNLLMDQADEYWCVVTTTGATNGEPSLESSKATLTVFQTAYITVDPSSLTKWPGESASFSITAIGEPDVTYQWEKDDVELDDETANTLTIGSVVRSDGGVYKCTATNDGGSSTSEPATLTVNGPAEIDEDPENTTVYTGRRIVLSVSASGTAPLSYQWQKNDVDIPDATNRRYIKDNAALADAGNYKCIVSNNSGANTDVSATATLTVKVTAYVTAHPSPLTKNPGESATFSVTAAGEAQILYQWYKSNNAIPNATEATYTIPSVVANNAGYYRCRVRNDGGYDNSNWALLTVNGPAIVVEDPKDTVGWTGGEVAFGVVASGTAPLSYQWQKNYADIVGATDALLSLTSLTLSDSGYYRVIVSNTLNIDTSSNAHLQMKITVSITEQPESQTVHEGDTVSFSAAATGTETITYRWYKNGFPISGAENDTFAIEKVTSADAGDYACVARNGGGRDTSAIASLEVLGAALTLTAPNGGETWNIETTQDITWTTNGNLDNVKLEFSSSGGSSWQLITPSTPNTGTYAWVVPIVITEFCKIRISDAEDDFPADESDSLFTINKITAIQGESKVPESLCSRFLIAPNPVYLNETNTVQFLVTQGSRMVNAEVKIYDALGNLIYAFENNHIEGYPLGSCNTIGSWDLTNTNQRKVASGVYLAVVLFTGPEGEKEIVKQIIGIKNEQ